MCRITKTSFYSLLLIVFLLGDVTNIFAYNHINTINSRMHYDNNVNINHPVIKNIDTIGHGSVIDHPVVQDMDTVDPSSAIDHSVVQNIDAISSSSVIDRSAIPGMGIIKPSSIKGSTANSTANVEIPKYSIPQSQSPHINVLSPKPGQTVHGVTSIRLNIINYAQLAEVEFYTKRLNHDLSYLGTAKVDGDFLVYEFDTKNLPNGDYYLIVKYNEDKNLNNSYFPHIFIHINNVITESSVDQIATLNDHVNEMKEVVKDIEQDIDKNENYLEKIKKNNTEDKNVVEKHINKKEVVKDRGGVPKDIEQDIGKNKSVTNNISLNYTKDSLSTSTISSSSEFTKGKKAHLIMPDIIDSNTLNKKNTNQNNNVDIVTTITTTTIANISTTSSIVVDDKDNIDDVVDVDEIKAIEQKITGQKNDIVNIGESIDKIEKNIDIINTKDNIKDYLEVNNKEIEKIKIDIIDTKNEIVKKQQDNVSIKRDIEKIVHDSDLSNVVITDNDDSSNITRESVEQNNLEEDIAPEEQKKTKIISFTRFSPNNNVFTDSDSDGLSDTDELKYGTDPMNPDTDNDGYLDGVEVGDGYNPNGTGKLNFNPGTAVIDPNNILIDTDGDGLTDNEELIVGTDPMNPDSDYDGKLDGEEVNYGTNPLLAGNADEIKYEEPKTSGTINRDIFQVLSVENVIKGGGDSISPTSTATSTFATSTPMDNSKYKLKGKAIPNSFVVLYIYSDDPIVVTVRTDKNGNWEYKLDKTLEDGHHQVYVAVTNNSGKIIAKSEPFSFFVKKALAVDNEDNFRMIGNSNVQEPVDSLLFGYKMFFGVLIALSFILIIVSFSYFTGKIRL